MPNHRPTRALQIEVAMSRFASDLLSLIAMPRNDDGKLGGLVEVLLRAMAVDFIALGVAD